MNEIEVKILEISKKDLTQKLLDAGGKKIFSWNIEAEFFITENHKKIRLRKYADHNTLTYKVKNDAVSLFKQAQEFECDFDNYDDFVFILESLGCTKCGSSSKFRESYVLNDIRYDFDSIEGIPDFVEIEATSPEKVEEWVQFLGYTLADTKNFWEKELKNYYGKS